MRQSALLLVSLACLQAGLACAASATEPARCESPPGEKTTGASGDAASAANARGNELARGGDALAALAAHQEAERLARVQGDSGLALRAAANAARDAVDAGQLDGVRVRLVALRVEIESVPDADARAALLLHVGRSLARLSATDSSAGPEAVATLRAAESAARASANQRLLSFAIGCARASSTSGASLSPWIRRAARATG